MDMAELPWGNVALCCAGAGALYLLGQSYQNEADALRSIPRIARFKDLSRIVVPLVATLCGKVGTDSPIECKRSKLKGVKYYETTYEHYKKLEPKENENPLAEKDSPSKKEKVWKDHYVPLKTNSKSVPWYLDDGTGHVRVEGPLGGILILASKVYESARCYVCGSCRKCDGTPDCCLERKFLGLRTEEWILPIGKSLTVIGEVTRDGKGSFQIQQPKNGPFIVSSKTIDMLIEEPEAIASFLKGAAILLLGCGAFLIIKHVTRGSARGRAGRPTGE